MPMVASASASASAYKYPFLSDIIIASSLQFLERIVRVLICFRKKESYIS